MITKAKPKVNGTKVVTGVVRLSYANLLSPKASGEGEEPRYSTQLIIPKSEKATLKALEQARKAAFDADGGSKLKGVKYANVHNTLRDADEEFDTDAEKPELKDCYFMNVSSKTKPGIVKRVNGANVETDDPEEVYSGVYAIVSLNFYAFNVGKNKGLTAGLNNVMVLGYGDYLGGRASANSDFSDMDFEEVDDEEEYDYDEDLL
ncbi:DUF2815 family protein [Enterococcus cecorum]|uniref:DUF2815 family protein n=1 Tax=Enterococcus cecorum TaxID=44008 RepID=UPI001FAE5792|nr:DUF2815 family protein [Enterococcus cecorum]MCJ0586564.1 DUF2815 family protein [Enterococcus cecorum]MCJ0591242.1 DUF2815 family protein [Enterococcus cecorum]